MLCVRNDEWLLMLRLFYSTTRLHRRKKTHKFRFEAYQFQRFLLFFSFRPHFCPRIYQRTYISTTMSTNPAVPKEVPPDVDRSSTSTVRGEAFNPVANHEKLKNDPAGMDKNIRKQETQITHVEGQTRPRQRRRDTGDGQHILQEEEAPEVLGFAWSTRKKWTTLTVIFIVQCSMNYNAAVYANGKSYYEL